ncbi:MAG: hypothetical protein RIB61_12010 [Roseicyclus sp.]|jgi:hypothetical protein
MKRIALIALLTASISAPALASPPTLDVTVSDRSAPVVTSDGVHSPRAAEIFAMLAAE